MNQLVYLIVKLGKVYKYTADLDVHMCKSMDAKDISSIVANLPTAHYKIPSLC